MLRRQPVPTLLAMGAVLAGTAELPAAQAQSDAMAVCRANTAVWAAAVATGKPAEVGALFAPAAVWVAPEGTFREPQEITRYAEGWLTPSVKHAGIATAARQLGDVILCSGTATETFVSGGGAQEMKNRWGEALMKSGNTWLVEQLIHTNEPGPAPQPQSQAQAR